MCKKKTIFYINTLHDELAVSLLSLELNITSFLFCFYFFLCVYIKYMCVLPPITSFLLFCILNFSRQRLIIWTLNKYLLFFCFPFCPVKTVYSYINFQVNLTIFHRWTKKKRTKNECEMKYIIFCLFVRQRHRKKKEILLYIFDKMKIAWSIILQLIVVNFHCLNCEWISCGRCKTNYVLYFSSSSVPIFSVFFFVLPALVFGRTNTEWQKKIYSYSEIAIEELQFISAWNPLLRKSNKWRNKKWKKKRTHFFYSIFCIYLHVYLSTIFLLFALLPYFLYI